MLQDQEQMFFKQVFSQLFLFQYLTLVFFIYFNTDLDQGSLSKQQKFDWSFVLKLLLLILKEMSRSYNTQDQGLIQPYQMHSFILHRMNNGDRLTEGVCFENNYLVQEYFILSFNFFLWKFQFSHQILQSFQWYRRQDLVKFTHPYRRNILLPL